MRTRHMSSRFVGRVGELAELERALRDAERGQPAVVLLGGDSGVGKTRLVSELELRLEHEPAGEPTPLVLRGEAVEQGEGELPYGPLLSALRPVVRARHPALQSLGKRSRSLLAALLPSLDDSAGPDEQFDPSAQLRLFEALLELLELLAEPSPVVLVLEDMHWADRSTRAFAQFLARSLRREHLLLILTYRTDELHRRHPLRPLLAELERLERARPLRLVPFDRSELTEALEDILGQPPESALVDRLLARSEGNPLYLEELLAAGLDGRGAAPESLRDAFMLRIERLSAEGQRAARAIAVGRALDEAMIAEVTGAEPEALQAALREAVAEHVLVAGADARFCFRHALLREAVYDDLLPGERGELHLTLAGAYERRDAQDTEAAAIIAGHYTAAGDQPEALRASVQAALAAQDARAYGDAADLAERALELWPRVPEAERRIPFDHVELLRLAAAAHSISGDYARAEVLLERALEELGPGADVRRGSAVLARLSRMQWNLNRGAEALETVRRALGMLPPDEVSHERAWLLAWQARISQLRGRSRDALAGAERALAVAVAAGDRKAEGSILNTLGMVEIVLGDVDGGRARFRRAIEIALADEDFDEMQTAYSNLADVLNLAGRTREALETAREGLALTPERMLRCRDWMELTVSELALEIGDWSDARAHMLPRLARLVGIARIFREIRAAELALGVGDEDSAASALSEIEPLVASSSEPQWIAAFGALLGELQRRRRRLEDARGTIAAALDRMELCTDDVMRIARVSAVGARVEADIAQRARDLREKAKERDAIARARLHAQRLKAAAAEGGPVERAWLTIGQAELARARGRGDPALWLRAADEWDAIERPYQAALARWRAAEAAVEAGRRADAAPAAAAAMAAARKLGSRWLVDEVYALAERGRLDLERRSAPPRPAVDPDAEPDPFGLTERERQVLALIAEGATNRQIGAALYMAEKTASVHVSRILAKLGVKSRTQAAALAHRLKLPA